MYILITYDVQTETRAGQQRLRRVARVCQDYGQRVQNSVFECLVNPTQCKELQVKLKGIIDVKKDSLRFYYLGDKYQSKIEHLGIREA